jgi:hypothetical protein
MSGPWDDYRETASAMPWGDVALGFARNLPSSLWKDVAVPTYQTFRHPLDTAANVGKLVGGITAQTIDPSMVAAANMQGIVNPEGAKANQEALDAYRTEARAVPDAVGQDFANAYGGLENFKATLAAHPGRLLMDLSTISPAIGASLPGKLGTAAGTVGKIVDPITVAGNAAKLTTRGAGIAGSGGLSLTTGAGSRSIRDAGSAGREFGSGFGKDAQTIANAEAVLENMNRGAPVEDVVGRAMGALAQMRLERNDAYRASMTNLGRHLEPMDFGPIADAVDKAAKVGTVKGVAVEPAAVETADKMRAIVDRWKALEPAEYHTPIGIDALKRSLGNIYASIQEGTPERVAASRLYNAVKDDLTTRAPEYSKIMESYDSARNKLNEATKTFSRGEKATRDIAARKLLSATRNNVTTNHGERARLIDELGNHDPTLPYAIAGQSLQALLPRGIVARGGVTATLPSAVTGVVANPMTALGAPVLAAFSPRIVGNVVYYGGRAIGSVDDLMKAARINPTTVRTAEQAGYRAGRNDQTANRGLDLWRQRNALQRNPYLQMGGP